MVNERLIVTHRVCYCVLYVSNVCMAIGVVVVVASCDNCHIA